MVKYIDPFKLRDNLEKLWDSQTESHDTFSLDTAKSCHSLIHNLVEAYKYEDSDSVKEILWELHMSFYFMTNMTGCDYHKMKVYEDRIV